MFQLSAGNEKPVYCVALQLQVNNCFMDYTIFWRLNGRNGRSLDICLVMLHSAPVSKDGMANRHK